MKKIWMGVCAVLMVWSLAACAEETGEKSKRAATEETKKETKDEVQKNADIIAYTSYFTPVTKDIGTNMTMFGQHFGDAANDPTLLLQQSWQAELSSILQEQRILLAKARNYDGPIPPELEEGHYIFMQAVDEFAAANDKLPDAMDDAMRGDGGELEICAAHMRKGGQYVEEAMVIFTTVAANL